MRTYKDYRSLILYILALVLPPSALLYFLRPGLYSDRPLDGLCFLILISGPAMLWFVSWFNENYLTKNIRFDDIGHDHSEEKYSAESRSYQKVKSSKKKKKSSFLNIFSDEKRCEDCDTELVYKEDMDSYFCPECRDYK